jgi:hypothetical protein
MHTQRVSLNSLVKEREYIYLGNVVVQPRWLDCP